MRPIPTPAILAIASTLALSSNNAGAQAPIRLVTVDGSRNVLCSATGNRNDLFSPPLANALQTLQAATFSGGRALQINAVTDLELATLANADVVLVANQFEEISVQEQMAINAFVLAGGGVVWFANDAALGLRDVLGITRGAGLGNVPATVTDPASPMASGPFGSLPAGTAVPHAFCYPIFDLGAYGSGVVSTASGPLAATFALGGGRVAVFCDEEVLVNTSQSPCYAQAWSAQSSTLLRNSVEWVAPGPGFAFAMPEMSPYDQPCDAPGIQHGVFGDPSPGGTLRYVLRGSSAGRFCAFAIGTTRAQLPLSGCSLLVTPLVDTLYAVTTADAAGVGRAVVEVPIPATVQGVFTSQALVLDPAFRRGFTASAGVRVSI